MKYTAQDIQSFYQELDAYRLALKTGVGVDSAKDTVEAARARVPDHIGREVERATQETRFGSERSGPSAYRSFNEYARDYPEGEAFRRWLTDDGREQHLLIFSGQGFHGGLPGGFIWAIVVHRQGENPRVLVQDSDDGRISKMFATQAEALQALETLEKLAPCSFGDLILALGYEAEP